MTPERSALVAELAPTGTMRVAINTANAATTHVAPDGSLSGPAPAIADRLAQAAGLAMTLVRYESAGAVTAAEEASAAWDVAFLAVDPRRAERLHFSSPYLSIEATYAVSDTSAIRSIGEVDRAGRRIATSAGGAYDLHLQRTLRAAERVPFKSPAASFARFREGGFDAVAGLRPSLERAFADVKGIRILSESFLAIHQAVAVPIRHRHAAKFIETVMIQGAPTT